MNNIFLVPILCIALHTSTAQADILPEPEGTESSEEDSAEESSTEEATSGCSSIGSNLGLALSPVLFFGWLALRRNREEQ